MNGIPGSIAPPGQLFVRALYDYDADDQTSLSFRQGDIIQVITQLESGWWDGVIRGVRGWFPSNYCAVVNPPFDDGGSSRNGRDGGDSEFEESEEEYGEQDFDGGYERASGNNGTARSDGAATSTQEEAAFWIPQATPDGRLYYFNTLTYESTMELPLEAPTSANETGPLDRTNIAIPEKTRPPVELMQTGYEREDDTDYASASEVDEASVTHASKSSGVSEGPYPSHVLQTLYKRVYVAQTNANPLASAQKVVLVWRRRITSYLHGFAQRSFANDTVAHEPDRSEQSFLFSSTAGYSAYWYHDGLLCKPARGCLRAFITPWTPL